MSLIKDVAELILAITIGIILACVISIIIYILIHFYYYAITTDLAAEILYIDLNYIFYFM
jgi:hypothetical protein